MSNIMSGLSAYLNDFLCPPILSKTEKAARPHLFKKRALVLIFPNFFNSTFSGSALPRVSESVPTSAHLYKVFSTRLSTKNQNNQALGRTQKLSKGSGSHDGAHQAINKP